MNERLRPGASLFVALSLAVASLAAGCHRGDEETEAEAVVAVEVVTATRGDVTESMTAVGTVSAVAEAVVSPKISAPIAEMAILKNKSVRAGETLARLEASDLRAGAAEADAAVREAEATLRQTARGTNPEGDAQKRKALRDAEAALRNAEALYCRRKALYDAGGISKKDLDDAELALEQARAERELVRREITLASATLNPTSTRIAESRLAEARGRAAAAHAQLDYAVVRSPISGVVAEQFHQKGDFVAAGDKLVSIVDVDRVVVKAQFPDTAIEKVKVGANARLEVPSGGGEARFGVVQLVGRTVDSASRTVEVWVSAVNGDGRLRPGELVEVTVVTDEATSAVTVPPAAVTLENPVEDDGTVMVVDATSVAHEVAVTVGVRGDGAYEIVSGLEGGETVVVEGNYALPDGTKVRVTTASEEKTGEEEGGEEGEPEGDGEKDGP